MCLSLPFHLTLGWAQRRKQGPGPWNGGGGCMDKSPHNDGRPGCGGGRTEGCGRARGAAGPRRGGSWLVHSGKGVQLIVHPQVFSSIANTSCELPSVVLYIRCHGR